MPYKSREKLIINDKEEQSEWDLLFKDFFGIIKRFIYKSQKMKIIDHIYSCVLSSLWEARLVLKNGKFSESFSANSKLDSGIQEGSLADITNRIKDVGNTILEQWHDGKIGPPVSHEQYKETLKELDGTRSKLILLRDLARDRAKGYADNLDKFILDRDVPTYFDTSPEGRSLAIGGLNDAVAKGRLTLTQQEALLNLMSFHGDAVYLISVAQHFLDQENNRPTVDRHYELPEWIEHFMSEGKKLNKNFYNYDLPSEEKGPNLEARGKYLDSLITDFLASIEGEAGKKLESKASPDVLEGELAELMAKGEINLVQARYLFAGGILRERLKIIYKGASEKGTKPEMEEAMSCYLDFVRNDFFKLKDDWAKKESLGMAAVIADNAFAFNKDEDKANPSQDTLNPKARNLASNIANFATGIQQQFGVKLKEFGENYANLEEELNVLLSNGDISPKVARFLFAAGILNERLKRSALIKGDPHTLGRYLESIEGEYGQLVYDWKEGRDLGMAAIIAHNAFAFKLKGFSGENTPESDNGRNLLAAKKAKKSDKQLS